MKRRLRTRRGQSILEYLVIATVIVAAVLAVKTTVSGHINNLYNQAANRTSDAVTSLSNKFTE